MQTARRVALAVLLAAAPLCANAVLTLKPWRKPPVARLMKVASD
jgi:hypothetical protein